MKFSVNWLGEFVELPESTGALAELLTLAGVEIEGIEKRGVDFEKVVVAQITASSPHPNADRLSVCQVNDGSGQSRQIVCGAKNYKVGDKVPLALPDAILANDLKIRASKLRGVESEGMLCSANELGISEESAGLYILSPDAQIGAPIGSLFPSDTILDVEITPNRGDLLSHFGLAREIAALTNHPVVVAAVTGGSFERDAAVTAATTEVEITALRECPFYSARRIEGVSVAPSPAWLRTKIEAVGVRSINNIVDIANLVMLELGQPLHAFDADKLNGGINVRLVQDGEKFLALDGKTYSLGENNLVIADAERVVGIAGVMGGEETGVTETTRNVLLESAYFLPSSVRRTARSLNLPSDASYRFERGVDPGMILPASERATQLIREIAGGKPAAAIVATGSLPAAPPNVRLRSEHCDQLIGLTTNRETTDRILEGFGLTKAEERDGQTVWRIPTYRSDLRREADLIEEIVRAYGIDRIPGRDRSRFTPSSPADRKYDREARLRSILCGAGFNEVRSSKLLPRNTVAFAENAMQLRNPLSEDHVALRSSLVPGLLEIAAHNFRAGVSRVGIFEIGKTFDPNQNTEPKKIAILLSGRRDGATKAGSNSADFRDLKGVIETLLQSEPGALTPLSFNRATHPHLALAAEIQWRAGVLGLAGQLSSTLAAKLDATMPVLVAELFAEPIEALFETAKSFREIGKFPAITRDIAMIVPEALTHEDVLAVMWNPEEPLLKEIGFFDQLIGEEAIKKFGPGKKSLAYTLTYRDQNRTLTHDEVNAAHDRIRERLKRELKVELRE